MDLPRIEMWHMRGGASVYTTERSELSLNEWEAQEKELSGETEGHRHPRGNVQDAQQQWERGSQPRDSEKTPSWEVSAYQ